jgi:outer membrane usher protein
MLPLAQATDGASGGTTAAPQAVEAVLELRINGEPRGESVIVLLGAGNEVWLERGDYARLRVKAPAATPRFSAGHEYLPLAAIPGVAIALDAASSVVDVTLPATAFLATTQTLPLQKPPRVARSSAGAFFNYELYGQRGDYAGAHSGGAWAEAGLFAPMGVLTSTAVAARVGGEHRAARLETTFTRDNPAAMRTLRLGDGVSVPGSWGRAARFAGLQWGTNFATRPDLVTTPLLSAGGEAVVPSTVDIFVNGQQVGSTEVPAGPFVIDRLPAVTGTGNVRLVVNDALGRTQVVTLPFYSSPALLRPGLKQYSVSAATTTARCWRRPPGVRD